MRSTRDKGVSHPERRFRELLETKSAPRWSRTTRSRLQNGRTPTRAQRGWWLKWTVLRESNPPDQLGRLEPEPLGQARKKPMGDALPGFEISPKDPAPRMERGSADRFLRSALAYRLANMGEKWRSCRLACTRAQLSGRAQSGEVSEPGGPARHEGAALLD